MLFNLGSLLTFASITLAAPTADILGRATGSLDSFIAAENPVALNGVLANIGPSGSKSQGAASGLIIASPSTSNPNYLYTWSRDAALTMKMLVDTFIAGNTGLEPTIKNYVSAQAKLQVVQNPSGGLSTGGLAEPKFNVDGTAFTGAWGRPQRDGPALR
jgi:glucoamylase